MIDKTALTSFGAGCLRTHDKVRDLALVDNVLPKQIKSIKLDTGMATAQCINKLNN